MEFGIPMEFLGFQNAPRGIPSAQSGLPTWLVDCDGHGSEVQNRYFHTKKNFSLFLKDHGYYQSVDSLTLTLTLTLTLYFLAVTASRHDTTPSRHHGQ